MYFQSLPRRVGVLITMIGGLLAMARERKGYTGGKPAAEIVACDDMQWKIDTLINNEKKKRESE